MFKQTEAYGCGLYSIANLLNAPGFITPERLELSKQGNRDYQLSKWLEQDGYGCCIAPLYFNIVEQNDQNNVPQVPPEIKSLRSQTNSPFPLLISGKYKAGSQLNHQICGWLYNDGRLAICDSWSGKVHRIQLHEIQTVFEVVLSINSLADINTGEWIGFIKPDEVDQ